MGILCLEVCDCVEPVFWDQWLRPTYIRLNKHYALKEDRLCGLVVRVSGYISRGPGSIPGATRISDN
jgi:hypothetical protein